MSEYQRQHYVPKFLQRLFSVDGMSIGCYSFNQNRKFTTSIRTIAQKSWYYKFDENEKTALEHWLGDIETDVAPVFERMASDTTYELTTEEYEGCLAYALVQLMRTPKAANAMDYVYKFCKKHLIPSFMEDVRKGLRTDKNIPFQTILGVSSVIENWPGKTMLVLRNNTGKDLIMSDNPACLFSPIEEYATRVGISDRLIRQPAFSSCMLYLPVGPTCGLLLYDESYYIFSCRKIFNLTLEDVMTLNSLEIQNATDILLFKDGTFAECDYKEALQYRESEHFRIKQKTIYTPLKENFCLSALNCDKAIWSYKISELACLKPEATKPKLDGLNF